MIPPLTRRDALKATTAVVLGGALAAAAAACAGDARTPPRDAPPERPRALSADDEALAEAIADTLLPTTAASPGARAAGAGATMNLLLTDCYDAAARRRLVRGLADLRAACRDRCPGGFASLPAAERERLLRELDAAARRAGDDHWFHLARELALRAYFTSEVGMTRALRYVLTPGRWTGCVPLAPGQPAWG